MLFVPWQYIADWKCESCGICCKRYSVVLNVQEWLRIVKTYSAELTVSDLTKLYIKRKNDGTCSFLCDFANPSLCALQHMKPEACKLWPFKVLSTPKYGYPQQAAYNYCGRTFFVYADSNCTGLKYGTPSWSFANFTVKEFTEIALGFNSCQMKSTGSLVPKLRRSFHF